MSNFCYQCAVLLQFPTNDWAGRSTQDDTDNGLYTWALCEDCGPIYVDHEGRCVSEDCHGATSPYGHRQPFAVEILRRHDEYWRRRRGRIGVLYRLKDYLLGSWDAPGLIHEIRWRYFNWKGRWFGVESFDFDDYTDEQDG